MTRRSRFKAAGRNDAWFAGACVVGLIIWGLASQAQAQAANPDTTAQNASQNASEASGPDIAFNVAVGSDYVFRGVSQTEEGAAISAGVDLTSGSFYAGAWASNVSFADDDDTNAEVDVYGGYRTEVSGWAVDVGGIVYLYANQPDGADYDYVEAKLAVSRAVGPATIGGAVFYSPDFFGASEDEATYIEANAGFSPADRWTVSAAVGRQFVSSEADYTTWNVGAAYQLTDDLMLDGRYYDTSEHDFGAVYDSRVVASIKAVF